MTQITAPHNETPTPVPPAMIQTSTQDVAVQRLAASVAAAQANWQAFLALAAKMPQYSMRNLLLIHLQNPDATLVQGFNNWKKLGRFVKKGEKGILIYAPRLTKNDDGEKSMKGCHAVYVFDLNQTDGAELPSPPQDNSDGPDERAKSLFERLRTWLQSEGCPVTTTNLSAQNASGRYHPKEHRIELHEGNGEILNFGTLIHEATHAILHRDKTNEEVSKQARELEAESVTALVCEHFKVPRVSAFDYLAYFEATPEEVLKRGEVIAKTSRSLIAALTAKEAEA